MWGIPLLLANESVNNIVISGGRIKRAHDITKGFGATDDNNYYRLLILHNNQYAW